LRQVGVDRPVLEEVGAVVEDLSEASFFDEFFGESDRGDLTIVVPDRVGNAGLLDRLDHLFAFGPVHRQRLFTEDHLAGCGAGEGDFLMQVVGRANVDRVDVLSFDEFSPIAFDGLIAPLIGELLGLGGIAGGDRFQGRTVFEIEEVIDAVCSRWNGRVP